MTARILVALSARSPLATVPAPDRSIEVKRTEGEGTEGEGTEGEGTEGEGIEGEATGGKTTEGNKIAGWGFDTTT
jgi:hypothetical protein